MGRDGLKGSERIRAAGGRLVVQDQASSVVWGMPGAVAQAGLANDVVPLDKVAETLVGAVGTTRRPHLHRLPPAAAASPAGPARATATAGGGW
jgi:two-component system chemotaxis response regulator CheB